MSVFIPLFILSYEVLSLCHFFYTILVAFLLSKSAVQTDEWHIFFTAAQKRVFPLCILVLSVFLKLLYAGVMNELTTWECIALDEFFLQLCNNLFAWIHERSSKCCFVKAESGVQCDAHLEIFHSDGMH